MCRARWQRKHKDQGRGNSTAENIKQATDGCRHELLEMALCGSHGHGPRNSADERRCSGHVRCRSTLADQ